MCLEFFSYSSIQKQFAISDADIVSRFIEHEEWRENKESSEEDTNKGPALYKGTFDIEKEPKDTFISMKGWMKGVCFVNGHNLGRYWHIGPQETLYIPAPFLLKGRNDVSLVSSFEFFFTASYKTRC